MDIFASQAKEIDDQEDPSNNSRYSETSNNYAAGFKYDNKLNSATLNGILHRITSRLKEQIHCSAKALGIDLDRPSRYCSQEEIADENCLDDKNYLRKDQWQLYFENRIKPYLLKEEDLMNFFRPNSFSQKGFLTRGNAENARGMFCGTDIVPRIIYSAEYLPCSAVNPDNLPEKFIQVSGSNVLLFQPRDLEKKEEWRTKKLYVNVKVIVPNDKNLREIEIRCSRKLITRDNQPLRNGWPDPKLNYYQFYSEVIPVISFDKDMKFGSKNIPANSRFVLSRYCRLLIRQNILLVLEGLPGFSQSVSHSPSKIASILTQFLAEKSK